MSKCVPLDQQPSTIIDEKLAANEPSVDTATVAMESETTNMIQENEIDSKMVREEATTDAAAEQSQQEEETTTSPIASQPKVMFDPAMMKKQLIEHFRKQLTVSAVRAIFLVLNELKRRQNMVHSQQQDVSESRIVESSVRSDGCECRCNPAVNNHDEDETEVVIIDKTSSRKRKEGKSLNRYLPKSKSDVSLFFFFGGDWKCFL